MRSGLAALTLAVAIVGATQTAAVMSVGDAQRLPGAMDSLRSFVKDYEGTQEIVS